MCTWLGVPGTPMFADEGLDRRETFVYLPIDGTWGPDGRFYYLDFNNPRVRVVLPDGAVYTAAGIGYLGDGPEGPSRAAALSHPTNLVFHPDDPTQLFVADWQNSRVSMVDLEQLTMRFVAGTGARGFSGDGGPARDAEINLPTSVQFDEVGILYVMESGSHVVRRIDAAGVVTTIAGKVETRQQDTDGDPLTPPEDVTQGWIGYSGDGGAATEARLHAYYGARTEPSNGMRYREGRLFFVDSGNHLVRVIDLETGQIDHVAGAVEVGAHPSAPGVSDPVNVAYGYVNGPVDVARFLSPRDLDVAADGTIYVADTFNHCVRRVRDGMVDTVAGVCGEFGFDGQGLPATASRLWTPYGVALSLDDSTLMIADTSNQVFRMVGL